jgi:hypothetical protein
MSALTKQRSSKCFPAVTNPHAKEKNCSKRRFPYRLYHFILSVFSERKRLLLLPELLVNKITRCNRNYVLNILFVEIVIFTIFSPERWIKEWATKYLLKNAFFWDGTPHGSYENRHFGGTCRLHLEGRMNSLAMGKSYKIFIAFLPNFLTRYYSVRSYFRFCI